MMSTSSNKRSDHIRDLGKQLFTKRRPKVGSRQKHEGSLHPNRSRRSSRLKSGQITETACPNSHNEAPRSGGVLERFKSPGESAMASYAQNSEKRDRGDFLGVYGNSLQEPRREFLLSSGISSSSSESSCVQSSAIKKVFDSRRNSKRRTFYLIKEQDPGVVFSFKKKGDQGSLNKTSKFGTPDKAGRKNFFQAGFKEDLENQSANGKGSQRVSLRKHKKSSFSRDMTDLNEKDFLEEKGAGPRSMGLIPIPNQAPKKMSVINNDSVWMRNKLRSQANLAANLDKNLGKVSFGKAAGAPKPQMGPQEGFGEHKKVFSEIGPSKKTRELRRLLLGDLDVDDESLESEESENSLEVAWEGEPESIRASPNLKVKFFSVPLPKPLLEPRVNTIELDSQKSSVKGKNQLLEEMNEKLKKLPNLVQMRLIKPPIEYGMSLKTDTHLINKKEDSTFEDLQHLRRNYKKRRRTQKEKEQDLTRLIDGNLEALKTVVNSMIDH